MARTLSANVTTGIAGDYRPCYLLQVVGSSNTYYWGSEAFTDGLTTYSGARIARGGLGKIKQSIDISAGGNIAHVNKFKFRLGNTDNYSDTLALEYFENRRVEVRLVFPQIGGASWANGLQLFKGYTDSLDWDEEFIYFDCSDGWMKFKKELPDRVLTKDEFTYLPDANVGKAIPIIYGDFEGTAVHKTGCGYDTPRSFCKAYVTRRPEATSPDVGELICASHDLNDFKVLYGGRTALWNGDNKYFSICDFSDGTASFSDGLYKRTACSGMQRGVSMLPLIVPEFVEQTGTTTGENAVNENASDYTELTSGESATFKIRASLLKELISGRQTRSNVIVLRARIKKTDITDDLLRCTLTKSDETAPPSGERVIDLVSADMTDADAVMYVEVVGIYFTVNNNIPSGGILTAKGPGDDDIHDQKAKTGAADEWAADEWNGLWVKVECNEVLSKEIVKEITDTTVDAFSGTLSIAAETWGSNIQAGARYEVCSGQEWDFQSDDYDELLIKLEYVTVSSDDGGKFEIRNLYIDGTIDSTEEADEVFFSCKGRGFGSWIDNGAHSNSFNSGDLIENPVYAIESLLIDSAGAVIGDIHAANFDAMATLRSSWKTARQILERADVYEFIRQLCYEFGFACYERFDGTFTARRIDATTDAVTTYDNASYALDQSGKPTFKIKRGKIGEVFNEFYLRYKINYATGEPEKVLFVKSPEQGTWDASYSNLASGAEDAWNKCHAVYTNFVQKNVWDYTAEWIRDDATAELALEFFINLLTRRPLIVSHESGLKMLGVELLDECKHSHDILPAADNATTRFKVTTMELDPETDRLFMEYMAVA